MTGGSIGIPIWNNLELLVSYVRAPSFPSAPLPYMACVHIFIINVCICVYMVCVQLEPWVTHSIEIYRFLCEFSKPCDTLTYVYMVCMHATRAMGYVSIRVPLPPSPTHLLHKSIVHGTFRHVCISSRQKQKSTNECVDLMAHRTCRLALTLSLPHLQEILKKSVT